MIVLPALYWRYGPKSVPMVTDEDAALSGTAPARGPYPEPA
jgi:hypothetical protein